MEAVIVCLRGGSRTYPPRSGPNLSLDVPLQYPLMR